MAAYTLIADGSTTAERKVDSAANTDPYVIVMVSGDLGGGTVAVEYSTDGTTWVADGVLSFSAAGIGRFTTHPLLEYRGTLSSSTSPSAVVEFLS